MELSVENMCGLLIRSKLLTPDGVRTMYQRWQNESKGATSDPAQFGKWLVGSQYLTAYQSALIARGQVDYFFLNEYKILDRIGQGRMAGVYRAMHFLGQVVAIKVLPPSRSKDAQMLARFQREARLVSVLNHPNVVHSFQVGEANGLHYIVMEYLDGEPLEDVLHRRGKLLPGEGVRLVCQVLHGLQHIHERGLVHRDLKPSNLMLIPPCPRGGPNDNTFRCTVKILDIGLGRALFDEEASDEQEAMQLTGEGVLLGTPDYLAPEQARDAHQADIRADIYSLGCVLYHLLTGQPPFPDTNIISQMVRHSTETPKPVKELNPAVPDGLQQIISTMLAKTPAQRYQTPGQAAQALLPFMAAGAEPAQRLDADPAMRNYLRWVESEKNKPAPPRPAAAARPAAPVAVVVNAPAPPGTPAALQLAAGRSGAPSGPMMATASPRPATAPVSQPGAASPEAPKRKRKKKRRSKLLARLRRKKARAAATAAGMGVDMIPMASPSRSPRKHFGLSLRDWLFLGVGAGSVILVGILGMLLANKLGSNNTDQPDGDGTQESSSP